VSPLVPTLWLVEALRIVVFGVFGLVVGSFLTVVADRVPQHRSIVAPRSACPRCGAMIRARDNIPVVSWLLLRGRCRSCGERISALYPATELATAGLFAGAAAAFGGLLQAAMVAAFLALLVAVSIIDAQYRIIPNRLVYPSYAAFGAVVLIGAAAGLGMSAARAGIGLLLYGGGLLLIALVVPRGMGMGDVKLAGLIGLVLGSLGLAYVAVAAGAAILAGGVASVAVLMAARGARGKMIPFGPFLALGAVIAVFAAPQISHAYLHLLGRA
jgi:leader peptidase (prepilin peptidase) / N-methyltransferase